MSLTQRVGTVVAIAALFATPLFASAQGTNPQITELLARIRELQAKIAALRGTPVMPPPPSTSCANITTNMHLASTDAGTGGQVTTLQNYLIANGYMTGGATGYFGPLTADAVGKLQLSLGIATSYADLNYGYVGPRTRGAIACTGSGSLSAIPSSGRAPLTVKFSNMVGGPVVAPFTINFGDGSSEDAARCTGEVSAPDKCATPGINTRTYANAGSYFATLTMNGQVVGRTTIVVTSASTTAPRATIDPRSLVSTSENPTISGTAQNTHGDLISFSLYDAQGNSFYDSGGLDADNGKWSAKVAVDLAPGTYTIKVLDGDNQGPGTLLTTGTLTILARVGVSVIAPNGDSSLAINSPQLIQWAYAGVNSITLDLFSTRGDAPAVTIAPNTPIGSYSCSNSRCSYSWKPSASGQYKLGEPIYKLRVTGTKTDGTGSVVDMSDTSFALIAESGGDVKITADPTMVPSGGRSTVSWSAPDGSSCVYTSPTKSPTDAAYGTYGATGSTGVGPLTKNATYTITCNGQAANVTVYVETDAPKITVTPAAVPAGGRATVSWSSPAGSSCVYSSPTNSPSDAAYGTYGATGAVGVGPLSATATYSITCGGVTSSATVQVATSGTPTASLTANDAESITVRPGQRILWAWSSTNAASASSKYTVDSPDNCESNETSFGLKVDNRSGTQETGPIRPCRLGHTYTVTYTTVGAGGKSASDSVTIRVATSTAQ